MRHLARFSCCFILPVTLFHAFIPSAAAREPGRVPPQSGSVAVHRPLTRKDLHHDVSRPLRELAASAPTVKTPPMAADDLKVIPLPPGFKPASRPDSVLQRAVSGKSANGVPLAPGPMVGLNFEGLGTGIPGFVVQGAPPDTNGAPGLTQYVQWVNLSFAVFDKATGNMVLGPVPGNALWSGFGGGCETENDGDPIVSYDKLADRWIFTQFVIGTQPFLQCVAVSTTPDATGTFNRYSFQYSDLDDYPKLGVWPDAYYITFNMFGLFSLLGADICAYDRNAMLSGLPATQVCFQQTPAAGSLLPADLDGRTGPPAGSPGYIMGFGVNSLELYKFHVDFANPAGSTLAGPVNIPVAPFTPFCPQVTFCVPQPGGDGTQLDSLGDRLMYRLAYRNFGDHESLVVNHSVVADPVNLNSGIRWYEIQNPGGASPVVAQQSTFAPDGGYRWMGSVAMDVRGNLAVGYSLADSTSVPAVFPSVAFAARAASDPLSTLRAETILMAGAGSQVGGLTRWGDYSAMQVDPQDDCTFWYTTEYLQNSGTFNWNTRIANFRFPDCRGPDLNITKSHTGTFIQGQPGSYTLSVKNIGDTPTDGTTVTVTDTLPAGLTATGIGSTDPLWICDLVSLSCTRGDVLVSGASYPPISVAVNVAANAPGLLNNTASVAGGGDNNSANNTALDQTVIIVTGTDPAVAISHSRLVRAQTGSLALTVTNLGLSATDAGSPLTVTDTLPTALTATAASGTGWGTCMIGSTVTCTRTDALAPGQSYPPIILSVNVAFDAPSVVVNAASISGGGDINPLNNSATDPADVFITPPGLVFTNPLPSQAPSGSTEFKPGTLIPIAGTATGPAFQDFRLQWAEGLNPATGWSTVGITLAGGGTAQVTNGPLGTWDTSGITTPDYYTLRLRVDNAGFTNDIFTTVYLEPSLLSVNWPAALAVSPDFDSGFLPVTDAAGKQRLVLVAPIYFGQSTPAQYLSFAPDGSSLTAIDISQPSYHNPAVGNVEGVPGEDVVISDKTVVAGNTQGQTEIFRPDNTSIDFQLPGGFASYVFTNGSQVLEDIGGTGELNVINLAAATGPGFGTDPGFLFAWRPNGTLLGPNFPVAIPDLNLGLSFSAVQRVFVADLRGDGVKEFIVMAGLSASTYTLQLFASDGSPLTWSVPVLTGRPQDVAFADLDHNGKLETLLLELDGSRRSTLHVFRPDGTERSGFPVAVAGSADLAYLAAGDLDRDGTEEIVAVTNVLTILEPDGTLFPGAWSQFPATVSGPVVLADIDGDGFPEILLTQWLLTFTPASTIGPSLQPVEKPTLRRSFGPEGILTLSQSGTPPALSPTAISHFDNSVIAMRRDGSLAGRWHQPGAAGNQPSFVSKITVGDFNQDGITDIAGTNFTIAGGGIGGILSSGVAWVLTTGAPFNAEANDWPMLHHDPHNSAVLRRDVLLSVTAPADGANVSGTIPVTANVAGPVASVQFQLDGVDLGPLLTTAPFTIQWNTRLSAKGPRKLVAVAKDKNGRAISSAPVFVVNFGVLPPTLTESFNPPVIALNSRGGAGPAVTTLTFTLTNANSADNLTGIAFTDVLSELLIADPANMTTTCTGTWNTTAFSGQLNFAGGTLNPGQSCALSVNVTGQVPGPLTNSSSAPASNEAGTGLPGAAILTVIAPPELSEEFSPAVIAANTSSILTFTITNPAINTVPAVSVRSIFSSLPRGLEVAGNGGVNQCGGVLTIIPPSNIALTGATIPVNGQCSFGVTVTGKIAGFYSITGGVMSLNGGESDLLATAGLAVGGLSFIPVPPCRIADTRNANGPFGGPFLSAQSVRDIAIQAGGCSIPAAAQAYSLNVTVVPRGPLGFLTSFPCGAARPLVSTLNSDGRTKAVAAIVPAGANGDVCFFATDDTDLVLDINGYFVDSATPASLAFYPLPPCRLVDTRLPAGSLGGPALVGNAERTFPILSGACSLPATAQAYSMNYTSVPKGPLGFLTTWPAGQTRPLVSTLNAPTGTITANGAIVPAGSNGDVSVFVTHDSDLVIDVNGYFAPPGPGGLTLFSPPPCRVFDTRTPAGTAPFTGLLDINVAAGPCNITASAQAFVFNATVVPPDPLGFLTLWPQGGVRPLVSTLNALDGATTSNMAIVPATNGAISAFASDGTHLVLDISGYFASVP